MLQVQNGEFMPCCCVTSKRSGGYGGSQEIIVPFYLVLVKPQPITSLGQSTSRIILIQTTYMKRAKRTTKMKRDLQKGGIRKG